MQTTAVLIFLARALVLGLTLGVLIYALFNKPFFVACAAILAGAWAIRFAQPHPWLLRLPHKLTERHARLETPAPEGLNLLAVTTPRDEARRLLRSALTIIAGLQATVHLVGRLSLALPIGAWMRPEPTDIWRRLAATAVSTCLVLFLSVVIAVVILFGSLLSEPTVLMADLAQPRCSNRPAGEGFAALGGLGCSMIETIHALSWTLVFASPLIVIVLWLVAALLVGGMMFLATGWFGPLDVAFTRCRVDALPPVGGSFLRLREQRRPGVGGLRHSLVYNDPETALAIAEWIAKRLNPLNPGTA
jgi:hypothetical protein